MLWLADLLESQPPTGEPSARNWPARFGGRGDLIRRPYPYHDATRSSGGVTLSKCPNSRLIRPRPDEKFTRCELFGKQLSGSPCPAAAVGSERCPATSRFENEPPGSSPAGGRSGLSSPRTTVTVARGY